MMMKLMGAQTNLRWANSSLNLMGHFFNNLMHFTNACRHKIKPASMWVMLGGGERGSRSGGGGLRGILLGGVEGFGRIFESY